MTVDGVAGGLRARSSRAPATSAGGGAATSRPRSAARTPGAWTPARAVEVALRLLDLGVDEVCFGDTIGVGVPGQVAALTGLAVDGRHPARADRLPLPRHARDGPRQRRGRARRRGPLLRRVDRRDRRLPVRAGRGRQPRDGGPRLLPRRVGLGARGLAGRRPGRGPVHRRRARTAARDQGRPGRRLGSRVDPSGASNVRRTQRLGRSNQAECRSRRDARNGSSRWFRLVEITQRSEAFPRRPRRGQVSPHLLFCYRPAKWTVSCSF